jgi:hypothetical protein
MKKRKETDKKQGDKFIAAAKDHGCDENEKVFADKMEKLASQRAPDSEAE